MVAVHEAEPPTQPATWLPVTRPLAFTPALPVQDQEVVVPQAVAPLQARVLVSDRVQVAFNWTVASSAMVAVVGAMATLLTESSLVTVIAEALLT